MTERSKHAIALDMISRASGAAKLRALKEFADDTTKQILLYTYSPFMKFNMKFVGSTAYGTGHINAKTFDILDNLADGTLSGMHARSVVHQHVQLLNKEELEIFKRILKGNQLIGIAAKKINEVYADLIPMFEVMRAKSYKDYGKRIDVRGYLGSLKLDGLRGYWNGKVMLTRNGHVIKGIDHITQHLGPDPLDGELKNPDVHFQVSSGQTRSFSEAPGMKYFVFDAPEAAPTFYERYEYLEERIRDLTQNPVAANSIKLVKHVLMATEEDIERNFLKALNAGYEGLVLKNPKSPYVMKRSVDWLKVKNELSEDLPIIGVYEGEDSFEGMAGGFEVLRKNGVIVRVGVWRGPKDLRIKVWENQKAYLGRIIEVKYHEETPDGSLRHPVFIKFREDKDR